MHFLLKFMFGTLGVRVQESWCVCVSARVPVTAERVRDYGPGVRDHTLLYMIMCQARDHMHL